MQRETPRYKVRRSRDGWAVLDTHTVRFIKTFASELSAETFADNLNKRAAA